jgi:hypothetical protein
MGTCPDAWALVEGEVCPVVTVLSELVANGADYAIVLEGFSPGQVEDSAMVLK